jgi:uncharacterized membrane protein YGL010W
MKNLTDQLASYAGYHRDPRNIASHFVGIPMIVLAVAVLLSRPSLGGSLGGFALSPALLATALAVMYYLRLDWRFGGLMAALMALNLLAAQWFAALPTSLWLAWGLGLFVLGWLIQFVGHYYEGKKPAFVDDLMGLVIGPLFVVAEVVFALGLRANVLQAVEARVGPVRKRDFKPKVG